MRMRACERLRNSVSGAHRSQIQALGSLIVPLRRFADSRDGGVAVIFGLMALALFMFIGLAVDYGRLINARSQTLEAADAAVLAGARALQTNGGNQDAALDIARKYYAQAVKTRISLASDSIGFAISNNGTAVKTTGNATITTPFMGLAGTKSLQLLHSNGDDYAKAVLAIGGNAELNLEISMMLDVSGSMGERTKLADMKAAATDLVNIVVWADQSKYTSKVAIVPFSGDVRPTGSLLTLATNPLNPPTIVKSVGSGSKATPYTYHRTACVGERAGGDRYNDALPILGSYSVRQYTLDSGADCSVAATAEVLPMTSDTTAIKNRIKDLASGGMTAGQVGTAWTYYMLSPKWAPILPVGSKPVPYGTDKYKKIAVLMTDGEYNSEHDSQGITVGDPGSGSSVNGDNSPVQAKALCKSMKDNGIEVYTVGFDLGSNATAIDTLSTCATDAQHFYNSSTGDALRAAFRDIALKISTLYLAQ